MKDIINKLRQIIPPKYKWLAIFVGLIIGISAILELCALGMITPIILTITDLDALQGEGRIAKIYHFFASPSPTVFITYLSVGLLIAFILKTAFNYFSIWTQSFFTAKVATVLTENLTKKYVHAPYRFHVNTGTAELTSRMQSIQVLLMDVCQSLLLIFSESVVVLALTLAITIMAPMVALILLCFGVLSFFLYIPIKRKVEKLGQDKYEWKEKYNKAMFQAFGTIKEVKLFASEKYFTDAITDARWNLCKAEKHAYDISQIPRLLVELFAVILAMGILLLLINLDTNMPQLITFCAVFIAAMFRIMPSITRIQYNSVYVRGGFFTLRRLHHDLTSIESEPEPKTDTPITFNNTFDCNNITFRYGADLPPVIENFSLTIKPRECIALVGPSGGGKTTLVDLLMGFNVPESGSITADGTDIFDNLRSWRNRIGYVSQNVCLFNDSIRANIAFCHEDHIDNARVEHAMKLAQIYDFVQTLPEKEQTRIGEFGIKLSGGQRQRIAIARALYRDPEFLILDEATSALDNETEKTFIDALHALKGTRTIIMIAHRLSSIENCDRTITIPN